MLDAILSGFGLPVGSLNSLQGIYFAQPKWLLLLALPPVLLFLQSRFKSNTDWEEVNQNHSVKFRHSLIQKQQNHSKLPGLVKTPFNAARLLMQLLRFLILTLLILALAQPEKTLVKQAQLQSKTVRDVAFVVESSASFLLPDYQLNGQSETRMNAVKMVLDDFMARLQGNRFSLTLYAEQAYTLMPLTADATLARLMLQRLRPYLAGRTDEAMGEALGLALMEVTPEQSQTARKRKVVVLISDGLARESRVPIQEALNYAKSSNIPIYTVGVGSGSEQADLRTFSGLLYQPLEAGSLKKLANETGGQYYQVGSAQDLQQVLEAINEAEGTEFKLPKEEKSILAFYPLLILVVVGLFIVYFVLIQLLSSALSSRKSLQGSSHV